MRMITIAASTQLKCGSLLTCYNQCYRSGSAQKENKINKSVSPLAFRQLALNTSSPSEIKIPIYRDAFRITVLMVNIFDSK